jgi:hypothetical protein
MKVTSLKFSAKGKKKPSFPNVEVDDEGTTWYLNEYGEPHRLDGPAVIHSDGSREWWKDGVPHRLDGPALENGDGDYFEWWVDGEKIGTSEEDFSDWDFEDWKREHGL